MIKKTILGLCLLCSTLSAIEVDTVVPFSGSETPAATFYYALPKNMDLILGFSALVPGRKTEELDVDLNLGLAMNLPIIGFTSTYFTFDNHSGHIKEGGYRKSEFYTKSISLAKVWRYPLTDNIDLGLKAVLGEAILDGSYHIKILPNISPIVAMTISLF